MAKPSAFLPTCSSLRDGISGRLADGGFSEDIFDTLTRWSVLLLKESNSRMRATSLFGCCTLLFLCKAVSTPSRLFVSSMELKLGAPRLRL